MQDLKWIMTIFFIILFVAISSWVNFTFAILLKLPQIRNHFIKVA